MPAFVLLSVPASVLAFVPAFVLLSVPASVLAFVLPPCLLSCLLSSCCPSVAGQGTFRRRSGGFPSQVQQRTVPGPHFYPGPATVFGILCILASPVPDETTDRGRKPHGPGTQTQPTGDTNPTDRGRKPFGPGTEVVENRGQRFRGDRERRWQGRGASTRGHKKNSHREGESGRSRDDRIRTDDLFNVTEAL